MRARVKLYASDDTLAMVSHNFAYKELAHGDAVGSGSGLACVSRSGSLAGRPMRSSSRASRKNG